MEKRVIKADTVAGLPGTVAFNFDDFAARANRYLDQVRQQGVAILEEAKRKGNEDRERARQEGTKEGLLQGRRQAETEVSQRVEQRGRELADEQLHSLLPAMRQAVERLDRERAGLLRKWEEGLIQLAVRIAERLVRRTIETNDEITAQLVADVVELAAGSPEVTLRLHPEDVQALENAGTDLSRGAGGALAVHVVADSQVASGDCLAETRHGTIDGRLEQRLARIEEELLAS